MGRRRQLSFAFVGIHRWHGDNTEKCITSMNEQKAKKKKKKRDRAGYPAVYDYTFVYNVAAAVAATAAALAIVRYIDEKPQLTRVASE